MASWIKRRFGLHARRVGVYSSVSAWLPRFVVLSVAAITLGGLLWLGWQKGLFASDDDSPNAALRALTMRNGELERAQAAVKSEVAVLERQVQIERATHADLLRQVKELDDENAQLREDLALLQAISTADFKLEGVKVTSVRIEPNGVPGGYSYRFVLLQTGPRAQPFLGRYELLVQLDQGGTHRGVTLPAGSEVDAQYRLDFRVHQRIEGSFSVPPTATVRSVQLRVYEGRQPQPKLMQTVTLS